MTTIEHRREIGRKWYAANREHVLAVKKAYRKTPKALAYNKNYGKEYRILHPDMDAKNYQRRKNDPKRIEYGKRYSKIYRAENREALKIKAAAFKAANPSLVKEQKRKDYQKHKEAYKARTMKRYAENKTEWLKRSSEYQKKNPEKMRAYGRKHYWKNPDKCRAASLKSAKNNYAKNSEKLKARAVYYGAKRRAVIRGSVDIGERKQIVDFVTYAKASKETKCAYCDCNLFGKEIHIDHINPISRGGKHVLSNLTASCRRCNISKRDKTPEEFLAWKEQLKGDNINLCL